MRRIIAAAFALILILAGCAAAEEEASPYFRLDEPATPGLYGRNVRIYFSRLRPGPDGEAVLLGEDGEELSRVSVRSGEKGGSFVVTIREDMPLGQTVSLLFEGELQDRSLLGADAPKHDGIRKVDTDEKKIAITFDTAGGAGRTSGILDLMAEYGAHCTFFIQGDYIDGREDLILRISEEGHELGNHTMYHPAMADVTNRRIYNEITQCSRLLEEISGQPVTLYRPPSGLFTWRDRGIGRALGCEMILWTFDSRDGFEGETEEKIWGIMTRKSEPGAIILMHIYGWYTVPVLERYLPMMIEEGYEFVTVTELMQCAAPAGGNEEE